MFYGSGLKKFLKVFKAADFDSLAVTMASFDYNYFILHGEARDSQAPASIQMLYFPLELLLKCSLKEMIMIIKYTEDPLLLDDPYYKSIFDALNTDVRRFLAMKTIEEKAADDDKSH